MCALHTEKEKDLLRRYLREHWMRLEEEFFRPLRQTDLLTLESLRTMEFLEDNNGHGTESDAKGPAVRVEGSWAGFANLASASNKEEDLGPAPSKKAKKLSSGDGGGGGDGCYGGAGEKDEFQMEIEKLAEEGKELERSIGEACVRLMRYSVLELSVAEWRRREQEGDFAMWSLYEQLYRDRSEEDEDEDER